MNNNVIQELEREFLFYLNNNESRKGEGIGGGKGLGFGAMPCGRAFKF